VCDELTLVHGQLTATWKPEEIFGDLAGAEADQLRAGKHVFRRLARVTHPDAYADGQKVLASEAFERLTELWRIAELKIKAGSYGRDDFDPIEIVGRKGSYRLTDSFARGEISDLYRCGYAGGTAILKLARHPRFNPLLQNEAQMLNRIRGAIDPELLPYLPELVDSFNCRQPGTSVMRQANVLNTPDGLYSLEDVIRVYPEGVHPKDMAWIWRRVLVALGLAHQSGVIHGAVLPSHILIHPEMHGLVVIDWAYASQEGTPLSYISRRYRDWYPQEVFDKKPARPETDIAMAAYSMCAVMGGDPVRKQFPPRVPTQMRAFFRACTLPLASRRPDDAWELKDSFDELLERLYGPRKFRPFTMNRKEQ
jgi:serine/threonine protein kinase